MAKAKIYNYYFYPRRKRRGYIMKIKKYLSSGRQSRENGTGYKMNIIFYNLEFVFELRLLPRALARGYLKKETIRASAP